MTSSVRTTTEGVQSSKVTPGRPPRFARCGHQIRSRLGRCGAVGWAIAGLGLAAAVWTLVVVTGQFPRQLFPGVPQILRAGYTLWQGGLLVGDVTASLQRAAVGFVIGGAVGIVLAVITANTKAGRNLLQPLLRLLSPIPTIGVVPLAILWFGLGESSKTLVIALGVFVPVWINSHAGLASTPQDYLQAALCIGASRTQTLVRIILPEAAPDVVAGLRVGVAMAFVLIVVAEMTGTTSGLGYRIYQAQLFSQADRLIFCLMVLGVVGALCDLVIASVTRPVTRWASEEH